MSSTAHEGQFTDAPEPVRQTYDTGSILRRNVADLELALKKQTERAEAAEAELERLAKQKPVRWHVRGNYFHDGDAAILFASRNSMCGAKVDQLYAAPVPAPAVPEDWREAAQQLIDAASVMLDAQPFITAETYGGRYIVAMRFERLDKMQDCHAALLALLQSGGGE